MKLSKREKIFVSGGGAILVSFFLILGVINPAIDRSKLLDRLITQKMVDIEAMRELKEVYLAQQQAITTINKKLTTNKKNFAILSFLEETAQKVGIKQNIIKMKPFDASVSDLYKESSVELKVDGIKLDQLVNYLHKIENAERILTVKRLKVKVRQKNPRIIDVTFEVSTFELIND